MHSGQHAAPPSLAMLLTFPINLFALPLSLTLSVSLARFSSPFILSQTGCRQTFVKKHCFLPFQPSPFPLHSVYLLTICLNPRLSYPTVCNTFYRPSSFVLTPFRINLWFLELLESYWKVLRVIGVKINIIG